MEGPKVHIVYTRVPGFISSSYTPLHAPLCNQQNQWMVNHGSHSGHFRTLKRQCVMATVMVHTVIHEKCLNHRQAIHHFYMSSDYPYVDLLHNTFDDIWRAGFDETSVSNVMLVIIIHPLCDLWQWSEGLSCSVQRMEADLHLFSHPHLLFVHWLNVLNRLICETTLNLSPTSINGVTQVL